MESHRKCGNCESVSFIEVFMVDSMNDKVNKTTVCLLCKFPLRPESNEEE